MKLTVKDRIIISSIYPQESNVVTQIIVKDIIKKVKFTQDDIEEYGIKTGEKGNVSWIGSEEKDIEFSEAELDLLKTEVEKMDKNKKITQDNLDLCLKIKNEIFTDEVNDQTTKLST